MWLLEQFLRYQLEGEALLLTRSCFRWESEGLIAFMTHPQCPASAIYTFLKVPYSPKTESVSVQTFESFKPPHYRKVT